MPAQFDLSKLSVRQFAERFRGEMIPLSNTFSYFCASVPLSEEDLKEYLEEPVAALPPLIAAALPKISILLVPYLERANGKEPAPKIAVRQGAQREGAWGQERLRRRVRLHREAARRPNLQRDPA